MGQTTSELCYNCTESMSVWRVLLEEDKLDEARFCVMIKTGGNNTVFIKTTHYHKYLDQFLMVLLATFTTGLIFVRQLMCSFNQNIGLLPLVSIVLQKRILLWRFQAKLLINIFKVMCSFDQNIGSMPLVLIVLQKPALL